MARLDIESFKKGIELKKQQIQKLEDQIDHLQFKIDNTIYCETCGQYWDAMYLHSFSAKNKKLITLKLECPACHAAIEIEAVDITYPTDFEQVEFVGQYMYSIPKHKIYKAGEFV